MAFWGLEVKPGKAAPFVPPPDGGKLHLSQACLSAKAKPGTKAALKIRVSEEGQELCVCVLREGGTESIGLDLIFDQYTEFKVEGGAAVHLTGYFMPEYEMGHPDDSEDEEGEYPGGRLLGYDEYGVPVIEGGSDEEEEEGDSDFDSEEYDSEEEESEESDEEDGARPKRKVEIVDVTEQDGQQAAAAKAAPALPAPAAANGKAAAFQDEDVSASDDDEEEEEEEGSEEEVDEEESEEGSDDEEEEEQAAAAAAAAAKQQQQSGQKRKAEQQPAAATPAAKAAKADTPAAKQQQQQPSAAKQAAAQQGAAQQKQQQQQQQDKAAPASAGKAKVRTFPNGFQIEELKQGRPDAKLAKPGKRAVMRYIGKLKSNGKVFDQTKGNATFAFRLGVGEVIKGWDRGVEGMRVGDKRRLTIPPAMAYGSSGVRGAIPPNAWLVFDVELVDVK